MSGSGSLVLVAGIGNIFRCDDAFGVAVARTLMERPLPEGLRVLDVGIRGIDLAYALMDDGCDAAILVDAMARGGRPGTLYVFEPETAPEGDTLPDGHGLTPQAVFEWLARLGGSPPRTLIVGCEPGTVDDGMHLSPAVAAVVDDAADLVLEVAGRLRHERDEAVEATNRSDASAPVDTAPVSRLR